MLWKTRMPCLKSEKQSVISSFNFTGKHLCQSLFFIKVPGFSSIKKETLTQVFTYEFCQISWNSFFTEHLLATASGVIKTFLRISQEKSFVRVPF